MGKKSKKKMTVAYKWCEPISKDKNKPVIGQWVRSHIKFLRSGDTFKIENAGEFIAVADPFFNPELQEYNIKMIRKQ